MASIELRGITFRRPELAVLDDLDLVVEDGELLAVVGPSGAGKSSLLRIIAGLEESDAGVVLIGGEDVTGLSPSDRKVAMVFQENALIPFKDVRHNVAFPLEIGGTPKGEVAARVEAEARVLTIAHLLERMPHQLAAGHQQLVQAARALVRVPEVFLMDEPLARLDAHLRVLVRRELRLLQSGYGVTTVWVTNDGQEAMAIADRMAVLDRGRIDQVGRPLELYVTPATMTVAELIGSPPMSFAPARVVPDPPGCWIEVGPLRIRGWTPDLAGGGSRDVVVGVRAEDVIVDPAGTPMTVTAVENLGSHGFALLQADDITVRMRVDAPPEVGEASRVRMRVIHVFDPSTGRALGHIGTG
jgi:ABC-type sugar transport system ATPase subunit